MTIRIDEHGRFDRAAVEREAERLESLARDLRALLIDGPPRMGDHADAPVIHGWDYALRQDLCLSGTVSGHPAGIGGRGRVTVTSGLWVLDRTRGFARTLSRWYRLGDETFEYQNIFRNTH
ncbi:DUF6634 family protein [Microvirga sp. P5_D2]